MQVCMYACMIGKQRIAPSATLRNAISLSFEETCHQAVLLSENFTEMLKCSKSFCTSLPTQA